MMRWILLLCVLGTIIATTALYYHYDDSGTKFCDVSKKLSCTTVYKSDWSYIFGVPIALFGILAYVGVGLLVWLRKHWMKVLGFTDKDAWWYLSLAVTAMFLFQTFMTSLEVIGVIPAVCLLCLGSQAIITVLAILSWMQWRSVTE